MRRDAILWGSTLGFIVGVGVASVFPSTLPILVSCVAAILLAALFISKWWSGRIAWGVVFFGLLFGFGSCYMMREAKISSGLMSDVGENVEYDGVVIRDPESREKTTHVVVREETTGEYVLVFAPRLLEVSYGDRVRVSGTLEQPSEFETDLGRTFDYPSYLRARDIFLTMPFAHVEVVSHGEGNMIVAPLLSLKHAFMRNIESLLPEPYAGLGEGLLLGVKRALGSELEETFRKVGIIHVIVLSGYNIMLVVEAVTRFFALFFALRTRIILGGLAIIAFALMVGLSATVIRASLMALLALLARSTGKTYAITRALFLCAVAMLLWNPFLLVYDPGFQLSFLATLGLILLSTPIEARIAKYVRVPLIRTLLAATIGTQVMVLPILLYSFGEFSAISIVANLLVLPVVPIAMLLTFFSGLIGFLSTTLATPISFLAYGTLGYIITIAETLGRVPYASIPVPPFSFAFVLVAYSLLGVLLLFKYSSRVHKEGTQ